MNKSIPLLLAVFINFCSAQNAPFIDWQKKDANGIGKLIKADSDYNLIVVGGTDYSSSENGFLYINLSKLDRQGNAIWQRTYFDSTNSFLDEAFDLAIDSFDNIYISGRSNWTGSFSWDISQSLILKYDKNGNFRWAKKYGNNIGMGGAASKIKLFNNKFIYVVGSMDSLNGTSSYKSFIAQYDSSGILNWSHVDSNSFETFFVDLEIDMQGNAYAVGVTTCCLPGYDTYVTKFNLSGGTVWTKVALDSVFTYSHALCSAIDDSANIYIGGETINPNLTAGFDFILTKIDSSGNEIWFVPYNSTTNPDHELASGIILDYDQNCYLYGKVAFGGGSQSAPLITKFNKNGNVEWSWKYDTLNGGAGGNFYHAILGLDSMLIFGGSGKSIPLPQEGYLLASFKPSGQKNWIAESSCKCYFRYFTELDSNFYATGWDFVSPPTFDYDSIFTCKLTYDTSLQVQAIRFDKNSIVYPNPFSQELNFRFENNNSIVEIVLYDIFGKVISVGNIERSFKMNTYQILNGVYILKIRYMNGIEEFIKVIKI